MSKKILVVGGGGREHAIIKALKKSPDCGEIWCAPGNGGIRYDAKCKNIKATDVETMVGFAVEEKFDYVVVAQDDPLALGMVDELAKAGIPAFGPDKAAARIEASKVFSKDLMKKYGIPTAKYETFDDPAKVMEYIKAEGKYPVVIKADGLALGKGVLICENEQQAADGVKEIMLDKKFGASGNHVVVEQKIKGREIQIAVLGDGYLPAVEIIPKGAYFDYESKYQAGGAVELCPAPITDAAWKQVGEMALKLHKGLGLSVYSRSDFILDENGQAWCLEINTLPGMTPTSLVPQEAAQVGLNYGELCEKIVELSLAARKAARA